MKPLALAFLLVLVASCSGKESEPTPIAQTPSTPAVSSTYDSGTIVEQDMPPDGTTGPDTTTGRPAASSVRIESITGTNPLLVRGIARTFENNVFLRVRAGSDTLVETTTTAVGEMGQFSPWSKEIWLTRMPRGGRVTVEAIEHSAKDGSVSSIDSRDVVLPTDSMIVVLDFPLDCTRFRGFQRTVPKTVSMARLLAEALVAGPTAAEIASGAGNAAFPRGSAVKSAILRDGTLTVDFNERLRNIGGSCAASAIRGSVTETMMRLPSVERVVITAEGSEKLALQP